jgi:hypothetical protein
MIYSSVWEFIGYRECLQTTWRCEIVCVQRKGQTNKECVSEKPAYLKFTLPRTVVHKVLCKRLRVLAYKLPTAQEPKMDINHFDRTWLLIWHLDRYDPRFILNALLCDQAMFHISKKPIGTMYIYGAGKVHTSTIELVRNGSRASTGC